MKTKWIKAAIIFIIGVVMLSFSVAQADSLLDIVTNAEPELSTSTPNTCYCAPHTDEDVFKLLDQYQSDVLRETLKMLYLCYRATGDDVLTAWIKTLEAHLGQ